MDTAYPLAEILGVSLRFRRFKLLATYAVLFAVAFWYVLTRGRLESLSFWFVLALWIDVTVIAVILSRRLDLEAFEKSQGFEVVTHEKKDE